MGQDRHVTTSKNGRWFVRPAELLVLPFPFTFLCFIRTGFFLRLIVVCSRDGCCRKRFIIRFFACIILFFIHAVIKRKKAVQGSAWHILLFLLFLTLFRLLLFFILPETTVFFH